LLLPDGATAQFTGWILSPSPTAQQATIERIGPDDWESEIVQVDLGPGEQQDISIAINIPPGTHCGSLDLGGGDRPFGQVA
jgi:hypothetical protein